MSKPAPAQKTPVTPADRVVRQLADRLSPWQLVIGFLIGVMCAGVTMWFNIRSAARDAVTEDKFLGELAAQVRPSCIFDSKEAVLADFGANDLIESIKVKEAPQIYGFEITIRFKKHLANEPIINGLNVNLYPESVTRGSMNTWTFVMTPASTLPSLLAEGYGEREKRIYKFKLEILH